MPTALVTGATAGIGLEFARQLAARGNDLVLVARDTARLESVAAEIQATYGVGAEVITADLTDRSQLAIVEDRVLSPDRPVEIVVNNAGFGLKKRFLDNDVDQEQAMLDVLVVAVMRLSHAALRAMSARGSGGIINVSSVAAFLPRGSYAAAKAYVNSFGAWAANEYRPRGVTVTTLCAGFTKTEFHERMNVRRGSGFLWMDADFLVSRCLEDFDKGKAMSIPGRHFKAITTVTRIVPTRVAQRFQNLGRR
jgi:short-subunit dehydrogenase